MGLSCLANVIVSINNRVTYITNELSNSKHEYVVGRYCSDLEKPKRLSNCKLYMKSFLSYLYKEFPFFVAFCTKISHLRVWDALFGCKLCVKTGPAILKPVCVNKLRYMIDSERN